MKKQLLLLLIFSISLYVQGQNIHKLASPDGEYSDFSESFR